MTPYVASYYSHTNGRSERTSNLGERIATIPTENRHALIAPVLTAAQQGGSVRRVDAPHHTITASNKEGTQISCRGSWAAADGQSRPRGGDEPTGTITAKADGCVAVAFLAQNNYLEPGHDAREPLSTIVGRVSTQSPIVAFIAQHNGVSRPDGSEAARPGRDSGEPLATITVRKPAEPRLRICGSPIRQLNRPCGRRTNRHRYGGRLRQVAARQTIPAGILRNRRRPARERADADCYHEGPPRPCRSDYQCSTVHRSAGERARQVAEFNRVSLRNMPV